MSVALLFGPPLGALSENDKETGIWQNQLARHCPDISFLGFSRVAVHVCFTLLDRVVLDFVSSRLLSSGSFRRVEREAREL